MADDLGFEEIRDLATVLTPTIPTFEPVTLRKGTVTSVEIAYPPTITVTLSGGDNTPIEGVGVTSAYSPQVNDVVILAKQGVSMVGIGAAYSAEGWSTVTLGSGWAHNGGSGGGPVQYRAILDSGSWKIQWRGIANWTGSATNSAVNLNLCSLPNPDTWPSFKRMSAAQKSGLLASGTNSVRIVANVDGTITLGGNGSNNPSQSPDFLSFDNVEYFL